MELVQLKGEFLVCLPYGETDRLERDSKWLKKIILMFLSLLTVTVIGIGPMVLTILNQTTGTLSKTYKALEIDQCHCRKQANDYPFDGG